MLMIICHSSNRKLIQTTRTCTFQTAVCDPRVCKKSLGLGKQLFFFLMKKSKENNNESHIEKGMI